MNISATVGILILTVFLLLSTPVYAGNDAPPPYRIGMAYGYVEYTDETPAADDESVTLYRAEDPSTTITVPLSTYTTAGWWKVNLYKIPGLTNGDIVVAEVRDQNTTLIFDNSSAESYFDALTVTPPAPETSPATNGDSSSTGSSNSNTGSTYPPTSAATPTPTAAPDPTTVAPTDTPTTVAPTEEHTKAPTAATEIEETEEEFKTESTPGFGAVLTVFAIAGLLVATYLVMRRRE